MKSLQLATCIGAVLLCAGPSRGETRYGSGEVAARAAARQGGAIAERAAFGRGGVTAGAVQVPSSMMAYRKGNSARPSSAMNAYGGGHGPAAWAGITHAAGPDVEPTPDMPPVRYGFYPSASQPPHDVRKTPTYQYTQAASAPREAPLAMIEDEYRASIAPAKQEGFGAGYDRVIPNGPIGQTYQNSDSGGGGGGSTLMSIFMGGGDGGTVASGGHNRDQGGKPSDQRGNGNANGNRK